MLQKITSSSFWQKLIQKTKNNPNLQSVLVLIFWTFGSRALGLVREALVGRLSTVEADIFNASSSLNEFINTSFIAGSIAVAMLPQVVKLHNLHAEKNRNAYITWCVLYFGGFVLVLSAIGIIFARPILEMLNEQLYQAISRQGQLAQYVALNRIFLLAPILFGLKTILGVFLNVKKEFFIYSLEGVLSNLGLILGLTVLYAFFGLNGAAFGLSLGFGFTLLAFCWDAFRWGLRFDLTTFPELNQFLWQTFLLYWPRLLILNYTRVTEWLITLTADSLQGQITSLRYALNIQGVFFGLMLAVATVFLPSLSEILVKKGQNGEFWAHLWKYLRLSLIFSLFGMVGTILLTPLLIWIIQKMAFVDQNSFLASQENLESILFLTAVCSLSLVFQSLAEILSRYFIAIEQNFPVILATITGNLAAIIISFGLKEMLGATLAVSTGFVVNTILLFALLAFCTWQNWRFFLIWGERRLAIRKEFSLEKGSTKKIIPQESRKHQL